MPVPLKNSDIVERASCPFRLEAHRKDKTLDNYWKFIHLSH
ncbi:hypothetical protein [Microcoleus sp. B4-C1]